MRTVFLCGRYRGDSLRQTVANIRAAEAWALRLWEWGAYVLCPHTNTQLFDGHLPDEVWLSGYVALMKRCGAVAIMPGWEQSSGSRVEVYLARQYDKPVFAVALDSDQRALREWLSQDPDADALLAEEIASARRELGIVETGFCPVCGSVPNARRSG